MTETGDAAIRAEVRAGNSDETAEVGDVRKAHLLPVAEDRQIEQGELVLRSSAITPEAAVGVNCGNWRHSQPLAEVVTLIALAWVRNNHDE
ncbi:hypothetical protein [Sphaerimonospora thailandensis]|uniref:hypothetical protein n=1 Tax=Sphaerimonospora thailandensis TaxID=795644 RepID=UPI001951685F|nr:hypothetical protein [Sphaerimonospora thailandensis]